MKRTIQWVLLLVLTLTVAGSRPVSASPAATRPATPDRPIDPNTVANKTILVVPIRGEINSTTVYFVKRSLRKARREGAGVILFEFDTPGGRSDYMVEIYRTMARQDRIPTIGFVNPAAISAGAIILSATNHIYMRSPSTVGAAAPIMVGPEGIVEIPEREREKFDSFMRAEVKALSERNGHPFALFQAMIDQDLEVSEVFVDGDRRILTAKGIDNLRRKKDAGEIRELRIGELIVDREELLTLTHSEAERWGLSRGTVRDRDELLARLGMADFAVVVNSETGSERLARFLTHPALILILMLVGAVGIYVELHTPGFGVPGAVGIGAFLILFLGQYVAGLSGVLEPILFLIGVMLLAVEIFVTPGFGFLGAGGILLMLVSIVLAGQDFVVPYGEVQMELFESNLKTVFGGLLLSVASMVLLARYLPRTRAFNLIALRAPANAEGLHASAVAERAAVGDRGRATTRLRPSGRARFGDQFLDVVTDGRFLDLDTPVVVLRVDGNRIVVGPADQPQEGAPQ